MLRLEAWVEDMIKKVKSENLQKVGKTGKKVIKLGKKGKCSRHQTQFSEHKIADCCDKSQGISAYVNCDRFKELQKQIRECTECRNTWSGGVDEIIKTALINDNEEIEIVYKK